MFARYLFSTLICICLALHTLAQTYNIRTFSLAEGLPQSQVFALAEDAHGFLWIGTQGGGVCRFDGANFTAFNTTNGLLSNFIHALYADTAKNEVWAGTDKGLYKIAGQKVTPYTTANAKMFAITAIARIGPDRLLIGTRQGLFMLDEAKGTALQRLRLDAGFDNAPIFCLYKHPKLGWLVGAQNGLWIYSPAENKVRRLFEKLPKAPVTAIALSHKILYINFLNEGLAALPGSKEERLTLLRTPGLDNILCLLNDPDGALWAGTQTAGLLRIADPEAPVQNIGERDGLPHSHVRALIFDRNGKLWAGTSGGGLALLGNQAFREFNRNNGLPGSRIYALFPDKKGRLWVSASQNGLGLIDTFGVRPVTPDSGFLQGLKCRSIAFDTAGSLWLGTEGKGIMVCEKTGKRYLLNQENGRAPSDWVQKIISTPDGSIWVASTAGLTRFSGTPEGQYTFNTLQTAKTGSVNALISDSGGRIWAGGYDGRVHLLQNGTLGRNWGRDEGLSGGQINSMAIDKQGRCWVGTKGTGVFVLENDRFQAPELPEGVSLPQNVYLLIFDVQGHLWIGSERGVEKCVVEGVQIREAQHFGKNEGFSGIETCKDAAWAAPDGTVWFGTMNGLMCYAPQNKNTTNLPPLVHFNQVGLFYKPIEATEFAGQAPLLFANNTNGLELPWSQNHLSFAFRGVDLQNPEGLQYRWKLNGADTDWSPLSSVNQVNYANLAPGVYQLLVQASTDGRNFGPTATARFTILPPIWQRLWFQVLVFSIAAALSFFAVRQYIRRIRRVEAERREKLETQNRLLQLEQKALQLQMNPHFIFNALNSIQSLIATQDYAVARQEIGNFARLMRNTLHSSRKQRIGLHEEIEMLEQYLGLEQFCQQNPFQYTVRTESIADPEEIEIPPMLLQPFVENAVIHGVSHLNYEGQIDIVFRLNGETLYCTVGDNGIGREKAALLREARRPGHQSTALEVTTERLAAIGGKVDIRDVLPQGTEVEVFIPVFLI